jgi:hypothetical protein
MDTMKRFGAWQSYGREARANSRKAMHMASTERELED